MNNVKIVRVVSKNFVEDLICSFQNFFGLNLKPYEDMVNKALKQIDDEIDKEGYVFSWFRYESTQLSNGAVMVILYGEVK